jgi:hypothetical protein
MESLVKTPNSMEKNLEISKTYQVRYRGSWYSIIPKKYESERQTFQIAWKMIIENKKSKEAYREWFSEEQENAKLLYGIINNE